jgi:signal transduction histidine kinase
MSTLSGRHVPLADLGPRRLAALGRCCVALLVTALASVEALPLPAWSVWAAGLGWLPAATWLWFAEEGPADRRRTLAGRGLDLLALAGFMLLAPGLASTALLLVVPVVGVATYQGGPRDGLAVAAAAGAARWATGAVAGTPPDGRDLVTGGVVLSVVVLLWWARHVHREDARRAQVLVDATDTIMARSAEAIVVTDVDGVVQQANGAAERVLVERDGADLVGAACGDRLRLHAGSGRALDCSSGCALVALCAVAGDEPVEVWREVGDQRQPLLASATAIGSGGVVEVLHSFRDITRLKQADEAKTMFLATASHELKTPLTVIRGFTQLLQRTTTDPEAAVALEAIDARSRELAAIVDRLLLSSRIEAGRVDVPLEALDLGPLVRRRVEAIATAVGAPVVVEAEPDLLARANAEAVTTVVEQLVDNAVKYSGGRGAVRVRVAARGPAAVAIEVADEGIGMTPDQSEQCFDRFWQAEPSDTRRYGGTGIGLYIVRSLVEAMDGRVSVRSALGAGSTFEVALPAARPAAVPAVAAVGGERRAADRVTVDEFMSQLGLGAGG